MGRKVKWSWGSALIGAVTATATAAVILGKPKDPTFHLLSIKPTSIKFKPPVVNTDLILTVHITNPNIVSIQYSSTSMSIFYQGSLLGTAEVREGSQPAMSCKILRLPARLDGLKLDKHGPKLLSDVSRRGMVLDAVVDIRGTARVLWWDHRFNVHVDSRLLVDPVSLEVIEQESKAKLRFTLLSRCCPEVACPMLMES